MLERRTGRFNVRENGVFGEFQLFEGLRNVEALDALHRLVPARMDQLEMERPGRVP
jgi:hypothetical protein